MKIEILQPQHWDRVRAIYEEGIATGNATLEPSSPEWDSWSSAHLPAPRLVATEGSRVLGWAALSPVSGRCVYGGVAEVSVYVSEVARGRGVGVALLDSLVRASEVAGLWMLQSQILEENTASIRLHERCGFRIVGVREGLGQLNGVWRNVVLMERRSRRVGV